MTPTFTLTAPATTRAPQARRAGPQWSAALAERTKALIARAIGLPRVFPGPDGWYL